MEAVDRAIACYPVKEGDWDDSLVCFTHPPLNAAEEEASELKHMYFMQQHAEHCLEMCEYGKGCALVCNLKKLCMHIANRKGKAYFVEKIHSTPSTGLERPFQPREDYGDD